MEFFNGTTLLGMVLEAPYSFTWSNVPAGSYSLTAMATDSKMPQARLHALYLLQGMGALQPAHVAKALKDPEAPIREHAVKMSEAFLAGDG